MAVCDLSDQNPNVLYELGLRQAYDKPVVLIKDDITKEIFDVSGINYDGNIEATELMKNSRGRIVKKLKQAIKATKAGEAYSIAQIARVESVAIVSDNVGTDRNYRNFIEEYFKRYSRIKKRM